MTWVYVILVIFVGGNVEIFAQCLLNERPVQPQLSTTFMKGYWYEHLFAETPLQNGSCTHLEIKCDVSQNCCTIYNYRWIGYRQNQIWNGTITQEDNNVKLVINKEDVGNSNYSVNLKFKNNALLIWSCNKTGTAFASTLYRMPVNDDMMNVWEQASIDMEFPDIIEYTSAGVWKKIDPSECLNYGIKQVPSWAYILLTLGTTVLIRNA